MYAKSVYMQRIICIYILIVYDIVYIMIIEECQLIKKALNEFDKYMYEQKY